MNSLSRRSRLPRALLIGVCVSLLGSGAIAGCSGKDKRPHGVASPDAGPAEPYDAGPPVHFDPCLFKEDPAGCPCPQEGAEGDCKVYRKINEGTREEYIACSIGTNLCQDGEWGECRAARVIQLAPDEVPQGTVFEDPVDGG